MRNEESYIAPLISIVVSPRALANPLVVTKIALTNPLTSAAFIHS